MHFPSIDRFRAILAWTVVATHITWHTGLSQAYPKFGIIVQFGHIAVMVFIIISGFVITNLLLTTNESYFTYIKRRALRLFPAYLICLVFGMLTTFLTYDALTQLWGAGSIQGIDLQAQKASLVGDNFNWHVLAHMFLLQGIIPDDTLYYSQMMFLETAWSLSLEWQFYLVAPLLIACLRSSRAYLSTASVLFLVLLYTLDSKHVFGNFALPSFLPGIAIYFAIGILTRLYYDKSRRTAAYALNLCVMSIACVSLTRFELQPVVIWFGFIFLTSADWLPVQTLVSRPFAAKISNMLDRLGKCSYSTYLVHVPVIQLAIYISVSIFGLGMWGTAGFVLMFSTPVILAFSSLLYDYVERPAIAYGKGHGVSGPLPGLARAAARRHGISADRVSRRMPDDRQAAE